MTMPNNQIEWHDDPPDYDEQEFGTQNFMANAVDIIIASRSKNNSNSESTWTINKCRDALYVATSTGSSATWEDICKTVAT